MYIIFVFYHDTPYRIICKFYFIYITTERMRLHRNNYYLLV